MQRQFHVSVVSESLSVSHGVARSKHMSNNDVIVNVISYNFSPVHQSSPLVQSSL